MYNPKRPENTELLMKKITIAILINNEKILNDIDVVMKKPFSELTQNEMKMLDSISVNAWDLIKSNSGGHKCITNISGLSYLGRSKRPPEGKYKYNSESDDSPYVKFTKMIQNEFARILKEKIKETNNVNENYKVIKKKDLIPSQINYKAIKKILIKEETFGATWVSPIKGDADLLHAFERRNRGKLKDIETAISPSRAFTTLTNKERKQNKS